MPRPLVWRYVDQSLLPSTAMFPTRMLWEAVSQPFKRSQLGLFQGKSKQYGNNVPFSKKKTRRSWLPNVHSKRLFSVALGDYIQVKTTARALKTIKKVRYSSSMLANSLTYVLCASTVA